MANRPQDSEVPALELRDVWLSFSRQVALEAVTLTLERGGFLGIIGPNGAGKSVLLKILLGLMRPDRGTVRVFGRSPEQSRGLVAYVPQYARFDTAFPIQVLDVVSMGRMGARGAFGRARSEDRARAMAALEQLDVARLAQRQIGELSGGQLQRVLIARALVLDAPLLLLDEPTANLDAHIAGELYELLRGLTPERSVVLVGHDIGVMYRYVGSVACLNRRLHHHGSSDVPQEVLDETYGYPVDVLVHDHTHRVLGSHEDPGNR